MRRRARVLAGLLLAAPLLVHASEQYTLSDYGFGAGGQLVLDSGKYRVTFGIAAGGPTAIGLASPLYSADASFGASYPPPGEVAAGCGLPGEPCLEISHLGGGVSRLVWPPEPSAGHYNLYRGSLAALSLVDYGDCTEEPISAPTTLDPFSPSSGNGYFYLVTVDNRLFEEGSSGFRRAGQSLLPRPITDACP